MKRKIILNYPKYTATIQDYQYTSRAPVSVRIAGLTDGECKNILGEPCFFYKSANAMSMAEGITTAKNIIAELSIK